MTIETTIDLTAAVIDVRNIIVRVEELRESRDEYNDKMGDDEAWSRVDDGEPAELEALEEILEELCGCGGDEEWEGDWYPVTLIAESYFTEYAQELAEDCGMVPKDMDWPCCHIDWEAAAEALKGDYSSIDVDGDTYWYR